MGEILKPFVCFVNDNISANIQSVLTEQLFLTDVISIDEFALRVINNPNYVSIVHGAGLRVMVLKKIYDTRYNDLADIILYCKDGLISVESNKIGPPGITFEIKNIQIYNLFYVKSNCIVPDFECGFENQRPYDHGEPFYYRSYAAEERATGITHSSTTQDVYLPPFVSGDYRVYQFLQNNNIPKCEFLHGDGHAGGVAYKVAIPSSFILNAGMSNPNVVSLTSYLPIVSGYSTPDTPTPSIVLSGNEQDVSFVHSFEFQVQSSGNGIVMGNGTNMFSDVFAFCQWDQNLYNNGVFWSVLNQYNLAMGANLYQNPGGIASKSLGIMGLTATGTTRTVYPDLTLNSYTSGLDASGKTARLFAKFPTKQTLDASSGSTQLYAIYFNDGFSSSAPLVTGQNAVFLDAPWVESLDANGNPLGNLVYSIVYIGRSVDAWTSGATTDAALSHIPFIAGSRQVWHHIDIGAYQGTTNTGVSFIDKANQHCSQLLAFVDRLRAVNPECPILLTTGCPCLGEEVDEDGFSYYAKGVELALLQRPYLLRVDTYRQAASYAQAVENGWTTGPIERSGYYDVGSMTGSGRYAWENMLNLLLSGQWSGITSTAG